MSSPSLPLRAAVSPARRRLGRRAFNRWALLVLPAVAGLGYFFGYPVFEALRHSVTDFQITGEGGLDNYRWFFQESSNVRVLTRTITTSLLVTVLALALGFPYAYVMTTVGPRWRAAMTAVVLVPFWTSLIVRTYAWVILLQDGGPVQKLLKAVGFGDVSLLGTSKAVWIGMTQVLLPFMVLPLYATLRGIDRTLLLAAQSLGARPSTAFRKAYLPLALPGIVAGSLLVFVLALGFFVTPSLLGSPHDSLLSQLIVTQVSRLLDFGHGGAMAAVLLALTLLLLAIAGRFTRGTTRALGIEEQQS